MSAHETEALPPPNTFRERAALALLCGAWKVIRFPVAALLITTEAMVAELPKKNAGGGGGMPPGGGGMGGMDF